jgi:nucleotide-binding universal stress UspA family protein
VIIHVPEFLAGRAGILVDSNDAALAGLHRTAQQLRDEGIDAAVLWSRAAAGGTARMIVELAEDAGADLIVVGNRGDGPLTKLMLGSVASRLLQTARCPVLMVPARQQAERSTVTSVPPPGLVRSRA